MNQTTFYMVFLEGGHTPAFKHDSLHAAETEAKRLTSIHKAKTYVLCSIKSIEPISEYVIEDLRPKTGGEYEQPDDLPF